MTDLSIRFMIAAQSAVQSLIDRAHSDERGQDLLEWVMLSGLIAAAIVAVTVALLSGKLQTMVGNIGNCLDFSSSTACSPGW